MIYYAHSKKIFNTEIEKWEEEFIRKYFGDEVFNPNCEEILKAEEKWRMPKCYDKIKNSASLVFSCYNGTIEFRVYKEIKAADRYNIPIFILRDEMVYEYDPSQLKILYDRFNRMGAFAEP